MNKIMKNIDRIVTVSEIVLGIAWCVCVSLCATT